MFKSVRVALLTLAMFLSFAPLYAMSYIVPQDRDLVRRADAIAVVTAGQSHAELLADGRGVTLVPLKVGEVIKGDLSSESIELAEPGGIVGGQGRIFPGAPRYEEGKSYLVFLRRTPDDRWATFSFQIGQFELTLDINGTPIASRMGHDTEVFGFDEVDGAPHAEKLRDAHAFLNFVRAEVRQPGSQDPTSYLRDPAQTVMMQFPEFCPQADFVIHSLASRSDYLGYFGALYRWQNPTAAIRHCCVATLPTGVDTAQTVSVGVSAWNGIGAGINYSAAGLDTTATAGLTGGADGKNTVHFNDAFVGSCNCAYGQITNGGGNYTLSGDPTTYTNITEVDIGVATGITASQGIMNNLITHELGHTLGFRHSNEGCTAAVPCTSAAIMNSTVSSGSTIQQWDRDAANTVYGSGPVCTALAINTQPASQSISTGSSANLSVGASGSGLTYQWYIGNPGTTTSPVPGGTTSSISVSPSATTTYWVRVSGQTAACAATSQDSTAATVTVTCAPPAINQDPISTSVSAGNSVQLSVGATGSSLTYQWYQGSSSANATPSTGTAISNSNSAQLFITPQVTTFYSVRVSGACGSPVNSAVAQVTVTPAGCPSVSAPAPSSTGGPTTFTLTASPSTSGSASITSIAWFTAGGGASPFATTNPVNVTPSGSVTYFYQATNSCGSSATSGSIVLTGPSCSVSASANGPASVIAGASFTLTSSATGTGLSYQWYLGSAPDTSAPIPGATSQNLTTSLTSTTSYWVKVSASCGNSANSNTVTVSLNTGSCTAATDLCIDGLRYKVSLVAKDPSGKTAQGKALYQTDVFGYFSLPDFTGDAGNPEVFVKVLGPIPPPNGKNVPIVFYAGLTNLDYTMTVTDTQTGQVFKAYRVTPPPAGSKIAKGDFDFEGNTSTACSEIVVTKSQESPGTCVTDGTSLCLQNRFRVTMTAHDDPARTGKTAPGVPIAKNKVFGFFSTPGLSNDPSNVEAFVKIVNAFGFDPHFWVFLGGLTDVEYTIKVVDTTNGLANSYFKPLHSTCGLNDVTAFPSSGPTN